MCIKYDTAARLCLECADEYAMVEHSFSDSRTGVPATVRICVHANEHRHCLSDLLGIESNQLKVSTSVSG